MDKLFIIDLIDMKNIFFMLMYLKIN